MARILAAASILAVLLLGILLLSSGCEDPGGKNQAASDVEDVLPPDVAGGEDAVLDSPGSEGGEGVFTAVVDVPGETAPEAPPAVMPSGAATQPVSKPEVVAPVKPAPEKSAAKKPVPEKPAPVKSAPETHAPAKAAATASVERPAVPSLQATPDPAPDPTPAKQEDNAVASSPEASGEAPVTALKATRGPMVNPMAGVDDISKPQAPPPAEALRSEPPPEPAPVPREDSAVAEGSAPAQSPPSTGPRLMALRVGGHEGYDRLVFQFEGKMPSYAVDSLSAPAAPCRPGEALSVAGTKWITVGFTGVSADPSVLRQERTFRFAALREMELACRGENELVWVLGLDALKRARVTVLAKPTRLVVDVLH